MGGFTMIELVTILVIVGIMAVFVLPRLDLLRGYDEAGYRDKVVAALQFARKAAIAQRRHVRATVENDNVLFQIQSNPSPPEGTVGPWFNLTLPFSETGCAASTICHPKNVALTPVAPLSSPVNIEFDAGGVAISGAGTYTISAIGAGASPVSFVVEREGYVH